MKTYIIEYSSSEYNGFCIITEKDRRTAIKTFHSELEEFKIQSINEIKTKRGVIFNKNNVPLS